MKNLAYALLGCLLVAATGAQSPYAGQESREIKSLSPSRIEALRQGQGMGYAKAAELNHYPGPRHVLELADELALSDAQRQQTQAIFERMQARASDLGMQLIEKEAELDQHFAEGSISAATLEALASDIAALEGKIRVAHLSAHLEQRAVLTDDQQRLYDRLRGYDPTEEDGHGHPAGS